MSKKFLYLYIYIFIVVIFGGVIKYNKICSNNINALVQYISSYQLKDNKKNNQFKYLFLINL